VPSNFSEYRPYHGQRALVVGGSGGLGRAFVTELSERGAEVAFTFCRSRPSAPPHARAYPLDLRDLPAIAAVCGRVVEDMGVPSIVVNCAGILRDRPLVRLAPEDWDAVIATDLTGPLHVLRALVPLMMRHGGGRIVNVSSVAGLFGQPGQANYAAAKSGLIGMTRALARELGPFGISVNALAPGYVQTDMVAGVSAHVRRRLLERIPVRRFASSSEVVAAARVLLAPDCSYVNGHVLVVDGGLTS
jgi:3-oxoacyl-[acyl-carrier protein] reductase